MNKKYRTEAFAAIHKTMEALHEVGAISKQTMREFDEACLSPIETPPTRASSMTTKGSGKNGLRSHQSRFGESRSQ